MRAPAPSSPPVPTCLFSPELLTASQRRNTGARDDALSRLTRERVNVIALSDVFFQECNQHRIRVEGEVVAAFANAPAVLDFHVWLVWKSSSLRGRTTRIPLFGPGGLTEQLDNTPYAVARTFRLIISRWLRAVAAF
jgi:hypothetical protein